MQQPGRILLVLAALLAVVVLLVVYAESVVATVTRPFAATPSETGEIEIVLDDFRFTPSVIRVKAGQQVRIKLINKGPHTHEFMVGKQVEIEEGVTEPPVPDFFEGIKDIQVEVKGSAMPMGFEGMEEMPMGEMGEMKMEEGKGMEQGMQMEEEGARVVLSGVHAEGMEMGEVHGAMVMLDPKAEATLTFTVPSDKVGTWVFGCFQEDGLHFDSGMRGVLIVEP